MEFSSNEIARLASSESTYQRGLTLFLQGKVTIISREEESSMIKVEAKIEDTFSTFHVSLTIHSARLALSKNCTCINNAYLPGNCEHVCATLFACNDHSHSFSKVKDQIEKNFLKDYLIPKYKKAMNDSIQIIPIFHYSKDFCGIELKIGKNRFYIIKNIKELIERIDRNMNFRYGKDFEFVHSINAFDQPSRTLIAMIKEAILNYRPFTNVTYYDRFRVVAIPKIVFYQALMLFKNTEINLVINYIEDKALLTLEEPDIQLIYENNELSILNAKKYQFIDLNIASLVLYNNQVYQFRQGEDNPSFPLVESLFKNYSLKFTSHDYQNFFTFIFPKIKDHVSILHSDLLEEKNLSSKFLVKSYLDFTNSLLQLKFEFYYNDVIKEQAIKMNVPTNLLLEENYFETVMAACFKPKKTIFDEIISFYMDDEQDIYAFLNEKIDLLKSISEVYIDEELKKVQVQQINRPIVGVRFENNLLEIEIEDFTYDFHELELILKSMNQKKKYHKLKNGEFLDLNNSYIKEFYEVMDASGVNPKKLKQKNQVPTFKLLQIDSISNRKLLNESALQFIQEIKNYNLNNYSLSEHFKKILLNYQIDAFRWLSTLSKYSLGGILADEMGLGKTIEMIATIAHDTSPLPSIIITPASLMYNWENEFNKFAPFMKIAIIAGSINERMELLKGSKDKTIFITSYDYLKRDLLIYESIEFRFIVIDEAHHIKNHLTQNATSVKELSGQIKFALTGTPIENSLADLWSIFDFVLPQYLKNYSLFKNNFELEIVKNNNKELLKKLNMIISPFILRRTKKDVLLELPEKTEEIIITRMGEEQDKCYQAMLLQAKNQVKLTGNKIAIFTLLMRLRQIVAHPALFIENYQGESCKIEMALDLIEESIVGNHKILLFSQFTSILDLLEIELNKRSISFLKLTGKTNTMLRQQMVNDYNENEQIKVFLISLKAGGVGLNLTSADVVIHFDPWWNVSAENQASDRAHRIGQKNNVHVMKLITKNTIEEKILLLQNKKRTLVENVIQDDQQFLESLSNEELLSLFQS